jgi:tRNA threonylcarbamoyladenosine biosynthesis protein TsaE
MTTSVPTILTGQWSTRNPDETFNLGRSIGERLHGGEIILLDGPLGAGKTVFVKGLAAAVGIETDEVNSPSFTLVNQYVGRLTVFHVDLYRLDDGPAAAHAVDLDELIADEQAVVVIEWGERLRNYPLPNALRISIAGDGEEPRIISITSE